MDSKDLFGLVWMFVVSAITVLSASVAAVMSIERTLGRPIPQLRNSSSVRRNRTFALVLICMTLTFFWFLGEIWDSKVGPMAQEGTLRKVFAIWADLTFSLAFSTALGWFVFAGIWISSASWRTIHHKL